MHSGFSPLTILPSSGTPVFLVLICTQRGPISALLYSAVNPVRHRLFSIPCAVLFSFRGLLQPLSCSCSRPIPQSDGALLYFVFQFRFNHVRIRTFVHRHFPNFQFRSPIPQTRSRPLFRSNGAHYRFPMPTPIQAKTIQHPFLVLFQIAAHSLPRQATSPGPL